MSKAIKKLEKAKRKMEAAVKAYSHPDLAGVCEAPIKELTDQIAHCDTLIAQTRGGLCNPVTGEGCG